MNQDNLIIQHAHAMAATAIMAKLMGLSPGPVRLLHDGRHSSIEGLDDLHPEQLQVLRWAASEAAGEAADYLRQQTPPQASGETLAGLSYDTWDPSVNDPEANDGGYADDFRDSLSAVHLLANKMMKSRLAGGPGTVSDFELNSDEKDIDAADPDDSVAGAMVVA